MLWMAQGIGGCQVPPQAVPHEDHLLQPHPLPPGLQGPDEEVFGCLPRLGNEVRPAFKQAGNGGQPGLACVCMRLSGAPG